MKLSFRVSAISLPFLFSRSHGFSTGGVPLSVSIPWINNNQHSARHRRVRNRSASGFDHGLYYKQRKEEPDEDILPSSNTATATILNEFTRPRNDTENTNGTANTRLLEDTRSFLHRASMSIIENEYEAGLLAMEGAEKSMYEIHEKSDGGEGVVNLFNAVMEGWIDLHAFSSVPSPEGTASPLERAERVFQSLVEICDGGGGPEPDAESHSILLDAYLQAAKQFNDASTAGKVHRLLSSWEERTLNQSVLCDEEVPDFLKWYNKLLSIYTDIQHHDRARSLFRLMKSGEDSNSRVSPDVISYTIILRSFADTRDMEVAEEMLGQMEGGDDERTAPNCITYNAMIYGYMLLPNMKKAEEVLLRMAGRGREPDGISYRTLILGYKNCGRGKDAMRILLEMKNKGIPLKVKDYNNVIAAYARGPKVLVDQVELIVKEMMGTDLEPNVVTYTALMQCHVKYASRNRTSAIPSLQRCQQLFQRCHELSQKCQDLSQTNISLDTSYDEQDYLKPNVITYNTLLQAHALVNDIEGMQHLMFTQMPQNDIQLDVASHGIYISSVFRGRGGDEALEYVLDLEKDGFETNVILYNQVLKLYAARSLAQKAEEVLNLMESFTNKQPDTISYATVISAHARNGNASQAYSILKRCPKPNIQAYNAVLNAYANNKDPIQANALLEQMGTFADVISYNTVMNAWARTGHPQYARKKAAKASELLTVMSDRGLQPDMVSYNTILKACAYTSSNGGSADAFCIAMEMFKLIQSLPRITPDSITYGTMFKICGKFLSDREEKRRYLIKFYDLCEEQGLMNNSVRQIFESVAPVGLIRNVQPAAKRIKNDGWMNDDDAVWMKQ